MERVESEGKRVGEKYKRGRNKGKRIGGRKEGKKEGRKEAGRILESKGR